MQSEFSPDINFIVLNYRSIAILRPFERHARLWMTLALMMTDVVCLVFANLLAIFARSLWSDRLALVGYFDFLPVVFFFILIYYRRGLYSPMGSREVDELYHLTVTTSVGFLIIGAMTYFLKSSVEYSRFVFVFTWLVALGLMPLGRAFMRMAQTRLGTWGLPVLVIGDHVNANKVAGFFRRNPKLGLRPMGIFAPLGSTGGEVETAGVAYKHLRNFCKEHFIKTGLVVCSTLNELEGVRKEYRDLFENIVLVTGEGNDLQLSGASVHAFGGVLALIVRQNLLDPWAQLTKRFTDVVGAVLGLVVLAPLLGFIALLIKLDDPGRIFYRQLRLGRGGKEFYIHKFRTMHMNADAVLKSYLDQNPAKKQEWDTYQKLKEDPRITRVGNFLRRYSLDELPQLWNVLIGEMSLVGPRAIMLNQKTMYGPRFEHYERVTPGITGIWQVSGRNRLSFEQRTEFDVQYVMGWSVWLDIYLLVRTIWTVIRRDGAC
jgi:Undecaprenyl-phosphate galactose phosphotransferase WbaP